MSAGGKDTIRMEKLFSQYAAAISGTLERIAGETQALDRGAELVADAIARDELVHVIGPGGHSNMAVEEVLWRAGGLAPIDAILDPGTNLIHGAKRSNIIERCPGYGIRVLDAYGINRPGEVIVIINAYGINAMTVDVATEAKRRGLHTIGITSDSFARIVPPDAPSRHPSGKNLYELVDVYINNHLPEGDAVVSLAGAVQSMGPTSTFCNCFAVNCLMMAAAEKLVRRGIVPPVWMSANMPGGDEANRALEEKYFMRVKHLR